LNLRTRGSEDSVRFAEGAANVAERIKTMRSMNYTGWHSREGEPEDRNPFDSARRNREWIEKHLA
jgi:hypothetical protein